MSQPRVPDVNSPSFDGAAALRTAAPLVLGYGPLDAVVSHDVWRPRTQEGEVLVKIHATTVSQRTMRFA